MTLSRIILVAILCGSAAYWYLDKLKEERQKRREAQMVAELVAKGKREGTFRDVLANPPTGTPFALMDMGRLGMPNGFHPSPSPWESVDRTRFTEMLPANAFDVLVAPVQVDQFGLDRSTRSAMTAQLVAAVRATNLRVPDSYAVLRALGENKRQVTYEAVYELASRLGVKRVIWVGAGHDRQSHLSFAFESIEIGGNNRFAPPGAKEPARLPAEISATKPPLVAFQGILPQMLAKLGISPNPAGPSRQATETDRTIPASPRALASAERSDPTRDALGFLTYAALTPARAQRTRERFLEKAWLATLGLDEAHPDFRYLRARTLMLMNWRPAAIAALGTPSTDEEKALLGVLNGNLPEVEAATLRIKPGLKQILAELDFAAMRYAYQDRAPVRAAAAYKRLGLKGNVWPMFMARAIGDPDYWIQFDNLSLKQLLDAEFPIQGFTAEGLLGGATTVSDPAKLQALVDFAAYNHIAQVSKRDASKWCCSGDASVPSAGDYLDLVDAIGFDNLARRVSFFDSVQGRPQVAMQMLQQLESVYKGHPHVSLLRAEVEESLARTSEGAAADGLARSAYVNALEALNGDPGQSLNAANAIHVVGRLRREDLGHLGSPFVSDIPARPWFPMNEGDVSKSLRNDQAALENATYDSTPLHSIEGLLSGVMHEDADFGNQLKAVEGRFAGDPDVAVMRARHDIRVGDEAAAEKHYREVMATRPGSWAPYSAFSNFLFRQGRADEAARVVKSWPGFAPKSTENRVGIANNAYEAASPFFWNGHFDTAKWLFAISANLHTGAASGMGSESRLALMSGNYADALAATYARATSYQVMVAYRDYLSMLHATGFGKEGWDGFTSLVQRDSPPYLWESALVGHKIAGTSEPEVIAWAGQETLRNLGSEASHAALYLLRWGVTDHTPDQALVDGIEKLDRPAWSVEDGYTHIVKSTTDPQRYLILGPQAGEGFTLPLGVFDRKPKTRIKSDMQYFAQAYALLKAGKHDEARAMLEEAAGYYDMSQVSRGYMLPYLAYAAARTQKTEGVAKILAAFEASQREFDYYLSKAIIAAVAGKNDEASALLKKAHYSRPYTIGRPMLTEYEYAEILEWLYESTKVPRYRTMAIEWARVCQKTQPWHAWAYAVDAKLSSDGPERNRAIAMTRYLDPASERLKGIPKAAVERAVREAGAQNPFLKLKQSLPDQKT